MFEETAMFLKRFLMIASLSLGTPVFAQTAPTERIVTAARDGYTVSGLLLQPLAGTPVRHGIVLFAGHPGILKLRQEEGQIRFELRGNFLMRTRAQWLDEETLVLAIDAPSDQWSSFSQAFRETPRYGADVAALLAEVGQRTPVSEWTFVGTSEGAISAFHAARMNPQLARRVILTASVFRAGKNGPGLSGVAFDELKVPLLWVHHLDDPCGYTRHSDAEEFARRSHSPLITMKGGEGAHGPACMAFSAHGFVGVEKETVAVMRDWIRSGSLPAAATK